MQAEASPPDLHHSAVAAGPEGGGLGAPAKALPRPVSAADMNEFEPRALPCQGSLQVAEALGLRNVLPGRPRQGGEVVERQTQPHDGPSGHLRTRTKERTATINSTRTQTDVLCGLSGVIATDLTSYQPQPIAELATRAGLYPLGA